MAQRSSLATNPLAALSGLDGHGAPPPASGIGSYVTGAMLAAATGKCDCETCRLMAKASVLMRQGLLQDDDNG